MEALHLLKKSDRKIKYEKSKYSNKSLMPSILWLLPISAESKMAGIKTLNIAILPH
jgi:hypothetical protein